TGTMEHFGLCLLCLVGFGLILPGTPEPAHPLRLPGHSREETELVKGLGERGERRRGSPAPLGCLRLLLLLPSQFGSWFWQGWDPCAVRRGARIGKLCSCPRGTSCNLVILKCS
ncbi:CART protein, partial [Pitta sordida]|nr:CART protein [Pitta sordida]